MDKGHEDWLKRAEADSRSKQERFMQRIAERLKRPRLLEKPVHPFRGAPDAWREFEWSLEERMARFTDHFLSAGGHVARLEDMEAVKGFISGKAEEMGARRILRQNDPLLEELQLEKALAEAEVAVWNTGGGEAWTARAAEADFGIVAADHAVAYTGSLIVKSAAERGRSVSLLPTVLFAVIPVERLKTRLGEVLDTFDEAGRAGLPAGIHFISGPSRSADIENDLTIGVHGPGVVFALLVG
ncbi:LutC/YkgG family protein [Paenibacillus macerans]|uniref:LutC/YkgG family protein n=1 Tax=Paenibacillus macerans TaxID=44252 RepID=UPI003D3240A9